MKWEKYFQLVIQENDKRFATFIGEKRGAIEVRLFVLLTIHNLFDYYKKLSNMDVNERKIISGFANEDYIQWNIFGSTRGLGYFKNKIIKDFLTISNALDEIPLKGKVNKNHYFNFIKMLKKSFKDKELKSLGLVSASRLLSMKRPDNFICLNGGNKKEIYKILNIKSLNAKDFEGYWTSLILEIRKMDWWNSPRPKWNGNLELHIWSNRVAFMDSLTSVWSQFG